MDIIPLEAFAGGGFPDFPNIPNPIDPNVGQQNLLDLINGLPLQDIQNALDHFPVPLTLVAQAGDLEPIVENWKAGPGAKRINVDNNKSTGQGGFDFKVDVDIQLFDELTGLPLNSPNIQVNVERLGSPTFAEDVTVLAVVPFDAFNDEDALLPGAPNLFAGFQTKAADGGEGGNVPLSETLTFTPNVLADSDHIFEIGFETESADNPLEFLLGHFDGDINSGLLNATGLSTFVETTNSSVPEDITIQYWHAQL